MSDPLRPDNKPEEIEITPEMIEAGTEQFFSLSLDFDTPEEIVRRIYAAMREAA